MARIGSSLRRKEFVDAAVEVIAEYGVAGATTRRIAAKANSPLASLHYVFHTKDELFHAVYEELATESEPATIPTEQYEWPLSKVASWYLRTTMNWYAEHERYARVSAELYYWGLRNNPELSADAYKAPFKQCRTFFSETQFVINDKQLNDMVQLYLLLIDGMLTSWFSHNSAEKLQENIELSCKTFEMFVDSLQISRAK